MPAKKTTKAVTRARKPARVFSDEEMSAMRARVKEQRAGDLDSETEVLDKIEELNPADRALAKRIHAIVKSAAPELTPRLWYGMPAYAKNGNLICHFQSAAKFKTRYATLGFSDKAALDAGELWPVAYAVRQIGATEEAKIRQLLKQAIG